MGVLTGSRAGSAVFVFFCWSIWLYDRQLSCEWLDPLGVWLSCMARAVPGEEWVIQIIVKHSCRLRGRHHADRGSR